MELRGIGKMKLTPSHACLFVIIKSVETGYILQIWELKVSASIDDSNWSNV